MGNLELSFEQLAFMLRNHELIEYAAVEAKKGNGQPLDDIIASDEFQTLLGDMGWDDAYDRYEDMPEYDPTYRRELHQQLMDDIASGKYIDPTTYVSGLTSSNRPKRKLDKVQNSGTADSLKRLKPAKIDFDD